MGVQITSKIQIRLSLLVLLAVSICRAELAENQAVSTTEPICGYSGGVRTLIAGKISQGLAVEMFAGEPVVGEISPLRFRVTRQPQGEPVDDLQVEHEKLMHVIGVSDDLREFVHIHPQRVSPGVWQVNHAFTNAGRYQLWSDVKQQGLVYSFAQSPLKVAGVPVRAVAEKIPKLEDVKAGFRVSLETPGELVAGQTNLFLVKIHNVEGTQIGTEFFLGALLHVVVVKDDLTVYAHGHAGNHLKGERDLYFNQVFPERGNYKIFAQFRPWKTRLGPEEAILAEFWVKVRGATTISMPSRR